MKIPASFFCLVFFAWLASEAAIRDGAAFQRPSFYVGGIAVASIAAIIVHFVFKR
ncbi:MAG: hypothetical protein Q8R25_01095 [bacterium]|nr:hypothetical protein [bacterium]